MKRIILTLVLLSLNINAGISSVLFEAPAKYVAKKIGIKVGKKTLSEATEAAIKISCRETSENALKLAAKYGDDVAKLFAKYGDDAVRLTAKYGDDASKLIVKYGDDTIRIFNKYGDDGFRVFIQHSSKLKPLIEKYGDDIIKPYIEHPGLGDQFVKIFGRDAIQLSSKIDDEGVIKIIKHVKKYQVPMIKRLILNEKGKISKLKLAAILGITASSAYGVNTMKNNVKNFVNNPLKTLTVKEVLYIISFFIFVVLVIICKVKFQSFVNKSNESKTIAKV